MFIQEIKEDKKEIRSCKMALYRTFRQCGKTTWEQVIKALDKSGHDNIAEDVKMQLLKDYSEVMVNYTT